jgi:hypothetical protein
VDIKYRKVNPSYKYMCDLEEVMANGCFGETN